MQDPNYLYALMHGEGPGKKSREKSNQALLSQFDIELEKEIDKYVDGLEFEDNSGKSLQSPKAKRESIRLELKEASKLPKFSKNIESAIAILFEEGSVYLSHEVYENLIKEFSQASTVLLGIKIEDSSQDTLQHLAKISDESMKSIVEIAIAKFTEERFEDCYSLFSLLTILNPAYSEYWFRFGLAAQKCENYDIALQAYSAALELDPNLFGARLFKAECHAKKGQTSEAGDEMTAARKFSAENKVDQMWIDLIPVIEGMIT